MINAETDCFGPDIFPIENYKKLIAQGLFFQLFLEFEQMLPRRDLKSVPEIKEILNLITLTKNRIRINKSQKDDICKRDLIFINNILLKKALVQNQNFFYSIFHSLTAEIKIYFQQWHRLLNEVFPPDCLIKQEITVACHSKGYLPKTDALLERNSKQPVFDLNEVMKILLFNTPYNQTISFIYVIDIQGKVRFSVNQGNASHHFNISEGKPALGAGEVYLTKSVAGVEVTKINNRSGLYLPGTEFLEPLRNWFAKNNFLVGATIIEDEKAKQVQNMVASRLLLR